MWTHIRHVSLIIAKHLSWKEPFLRQVRRNASSREWRWCPPLGICSLMFIATKVNQIVFNHIINYELQFSSLLSAHRPVSSSEAMHKHVFTPFHPNKVSMTKKLSGWKLIKMWNKSPALIPLSQSSAIWLFRYAIKCTLKNKCQQSRKV